MYEWVTTASCNAPTPSAEVCGDGVNNDCVGVTDDGCDDDGDGYLDIDLVCASGFTCDDCDDLHATANPGELEDSAVDCDGLDNDCDGVVDESSGGTCYGDPGCFGVFDCSVFTVPSSCPSGCFESPGVCGFSGLLCDSVRPCLDGTVCSGGACSDSFASCRGLSSGVCGGIVGCNWASDCDNAVARTELIVTPTVTCTEASGTEPYGCSWTCGSPSAIEVCGNGFDDDGDGFVDCQDSDCQVVSCDDVSCSTVSSKGVSMVGVDSFVCLGTDVYLSSVDLGLFSGVQFFCGVSDSFPGVGVCCPEEYSPEYYPLLDVWTCENTDPCLTPDGFCDFTYSVLNFVSWFNDVNCLNPSAVPSPLACCSVVNFGSLEYWSDEGNVVIY